ncbi:hypothetical protein EGR_04052 [Echinococcus granulosus]|uniref:Uncharacterized protein n=1 Tax=Echinococcus granulosus TaxID=6210 RepID=W6V4G1_ECHGR|nr:hypothetical protein EGR_04052 [Echinococcus granulosus]EUB61019.1 hypothetical protein EGR_04052 [Echinococcus granulosus]
MFGHNLILIVRPGAGHQGAKMNPTIEKLEESVKVAWGNVALWKHRYIKECRKREALEEKLKALVTLGRQEGSSSYVDECLNLKKYTFVALEICSLKDAEINALRRKVGVLMKDTNELVRLMSAHTRKRANAKIVQLLKCQLDLELVIKANRMMHPYFDKRLRLIENLPLVPGEINPPTTK